MRLGGGIRSGGGERVGTHRRNGGLPFDARTGLSIPLELSEQRAWAEDANGTASPCGPRRVGAWPSGLSADGVTPRPGMDGPGFPASPMRLPGLADSSAQPLRGGADESDLSGMMRTRGRAFSQSLGGNSPGRLPVDRLGVRRPRSASLGASFDSLGDDDDSEILDGESPSKRARRAPGDLSCMGWRADRSRDAIDLSGRVKLADAARALGVSAHNSPPKPAAGT